MKSRDFCYWLQGHFELNAADAALSAEQVKQIRAHLAMVFRHEIDPSFPATQQAELNQLHQPPDMSYHGTIAGSAYGLLRC